METYKGKREEGRMCGLKKGCKRLRADGVFSRTFTTGGTHVPLQVSILQFNATRLELALKSDPRVRSWDLYVSRCEAGNTGRCTKETIHNVGSATHLLYHNTFSRRFCYYFQLQPVSHDPNCELSSSIRKFPSKTCLNPSAPTAASSPSPKGWLTGWVGLGVVGVAAVQGGLAAAIYFRCRIIPGGHRQEAELSKVPHHQQQQQQQQRQQQQRLTIVLLYAEDDPSNLRQVARLATWLTHHLGCQVYDIYDKVGKVEQTSDPCQCLLGHLAAASSSASRRVVLVVSPALTAVMKAVLEGRADQAMDGVPPAKRHHTSLLTAALKRLLEQDLVRNYRRVFVVSLHTETEVSQTEKTLTEKTKPHTKVTKEVENKQCEADANIDLLVEHRRYILPHHQQQLAAAILEDKMALEPLMMV
nr:uncharacterized protein LOC123746600 isoform X2 [Procambarus clarkii]